MFSFNTICQRTYTRKAEANLVRWKIPDSNRNVMNSAIESITGDPNGQLPYKERRSDSFHGGEYRIRTDDPLRARQVL